MRKLILAAALVGCTTSSFAHAVMNFAGIPWLSEPDQVLETMLEKDYELKGCYDNAGALDCLFSGNLGSTNANFIFRFDVDNELVQITMATGEITNSSQVYESLSASLRQKYGTPKYIQDKRSSHYQGINSQAQISQGIRLGEIFLQQGWQDNKDSIKIQTLKGGVVRIDYFSEYWNQEFERREKGKTDDL